MKQIALSLTAVCFVIAAAQTLSAQTDKRVAAIRAKTLEINKPRKAYAKTKVDVPGISTEGAEAVIYRSGSEVKKITASIYGESFKAASEFYFDGGRLIFSFDKVSRFRMPMPSKGPVVDRIELYRGYFDEGKMFRLTKDNKAVPTTDPEFESESGRILGTVEAILEAEANPSHSARARQPNE